MSSLKLHIKASFIAPMRDHMAWWLPMMRAAGITVRALIRWAFGFGCLALMVWVARGEAVFSTVGPGIEYAHEVVPEKPWSIHILKAAWPNPKLGLVTTLAKGTVFDLATVAQQAQSLPGGHSPPIAAVNGDFFVIKADPYQGDPEGIHIMDGEMVSDSSGQPGFWIDASGRPNLGPVYTRFKARGPDGVEVPFALNKARTSAGTVLFTPRLGSSTRTTNGCELILTRAESADGLPIRAGQTLKARVSAVSTTGNSRLDPGMLVLSCGSDFLPATLLKLDSGTGYPPPASRFPNADFWPRIRSVIEIGGAWTFEFRTDPDLRGVQTAVGGKPILIRNGQLAKWQSPPVRHPRTAVGWNSQCLFLVVVDGRQPSLSVGMTFAELADYFRGLGCDNALNLDGGGSSTLWLKGQVVNRPSDGRERPVANALVLVERSPNDIK